MAMPAQRTNLRSTKRFADSDGVVVRFNQELTGQGLSGGVNKARTAFQ